MKNNVFENIEMKHSQIVFIRLNKQIFIWEQLDFQSVEFSQVFI